MLSFTSERLMEREIAAKVRAAREAAGVSAAELAARIGLDPGRYLDRERGNRRHATRFAATELVRIAAVLDVDIRALMPDRDVCLKARAGA